MATRSLAEDFYLVWLDGNIDRSRNDYRNSISKLEQVVTVVHTHTDVDECIDLVTKTWKTVFMIISGRVSESVLPILQRIPQVSGVYIFCQNYLKYEKQAKEWSKVNGIYTDIVSICIALRQVIEETKSYVVSINSIKRNDTVEERDLDRLDCSFTYTMILKEILLTMDFDQRHVQEFLTYCRQQFAHNSRGLSIIDTFEREYRPKKAIWWFTYDCFINLILGRALRTMEMDIIFKMGFFLRDLHNQITALHAQQYGQWQHPSSLTVYRGQGLSQTDFEKLKMTQDGLLAFNQFLSTSLNRDIALRFARHTRRYSNLVGILFVMTIVPTMSTTPFANVKDIGCYQREEEILFSMHSVFRVGQVKQIDENDCLWEVQVTLTDDNDRHLLPSIRNMHIGIEKSAALFRIGSLMIQVAQFTAAEQIFQTILHQTVREVNIEQIYSELATIKRELGDYAVALSYHEKTLEVQRKTLPANHPNVATSYNNMALVYFSLVEYSKALSCCEKAFDIQQKVLPANHPDLAISYNNMGLAYSEMADYSKALFYCEKALDIQQKLLFSDHPDLATSYNNMGLVHFQMGAYSKALEYHERAVVIQQKVLPVNHPSLATSYNNMGLVYLQMREYSKALEYHERAVVIQQRILPPYHPALATSYSSMGKIFSNMGESSKALQHFEHALNILQRSVPSTHPGIRSVEANIATVKQQL